MARKYYDSYQEYLETQHWYDFKRKFYSYKKNQRCGLCGRSGIRLDTHHMTYERLGNERMSDCVALCRWCHKGWHTFEWGVLGTRKIVMLFTRSVYGIMRLLHRS